MIDIFVPLSDIQFIGELKTNGTNGVGDLVYLQGQIGPLHIDTEVESWNVFDNEGGIPDTVEVRVQLTL